MSENDLALADAGTQDLSPESQPEQDAKPDLTAQGKELVELLDRIHASYNELRNKLTGEQLFDQMVAGLSSHPNFIRLVQQISKEFFVEMIAERDRAHQHDHDHPVRDLIDPEGVGRYEVELHVQRHEDATVRVALLASTHPTNPNGLDVFIKRADEGDEWDAARPTPKMAEALRQQLINRAAQPYEYYWATVNVFTAAPLNEDSRPAVAEETAHGPE